MKSTRSPLGTLPLLQDVPAAVVDRLGQLMTAVRVPAGVTIISEGALNRQFVLVEQGTLRVTRGGEQIAELGPGDFVGELSLLGDRRATATVTTATDVRAYVSSPGEFGGLLHSVLGSHIASTADARRAAWTEVLGAGGRCTQRTSTAGHDDRRTTRIEKPMCHHTPLCPSAQAPDAAAARIVADHLQDSGYALLCNGAVLLEGDTLLVLPQPRAAQQPATAA